MSSFPTSLYPSICSCSGCTCLCVWMLVRGLLPFTCSSLSIRFPNQFLLHASVHVRTRAKRRACNFYPLASLRDGIYVYDVHCCKLLPCYGHVPTGLIEDPLELPWTRTNATETGNPVERATYLLLHNSSVEMIRRCWSTYKVRSRSRSVDKIHNCDW